jgi:hypothetical protein
MAGAVRTPELTAETIVGGIYERVYSRVLQGKTSELPQLLPDLAYSIMLPYLGHEAAERNSQPLRAQAPRPRRTEDRRQPAPRLSLKASRRSGARSSR